MTLPKTFILIPQYNDWEALNLLIEKINKEVLPAYLAEISIIVVDDCSSLERPEIPTFTGIDLRVVRLYRNLGHQRAIAIGLSYVAKELSCERVIVMDADGEDAPKDINTLIETSKNDAKKIFFAQRTKRQESIGFQFFYAIYKLIFRQLTGSVITFGNFSVIPQNLLQNLVRVSEIWNNYPGGIIKSRLLFDTIPIERAQRLAGKSKMNFVALITHGLSAISVLIDTTAVRILILSAVVSMVALIGIVLLLVGWFVSLWTLEGWAFSLMSVLLTVLLQAFLISLFLVLMILQHRTHQQSIPISFYREFINAIEIIPTIKNTDSIIY
jgi:polyisoprenyl-phosphate glycosyltransferase